MRLVIILMVLSLLVLHQDFWNWNREELSLGFLPIGLTYHIGISLGGGSCLVVCVHVRLAAGNRQR